MYYVGFDSAEIAKERVRQKVQAGAHGISEKDIERRYSESLVNLKALYKYCDRVIIYDNTAYLMMGQFINRIDKKLNKCYTNNQ